MTKLTKEHLAEQKRIADEIINEILNEEGIKELQGLTLQPRQKLDNIPYWESDKDFLAREHNFRAAAILLGIYMRVRL